MIDAIHLYRVGDYIVVAAHVGGRWVEVIKERADGEFSHTVEWDGIKKAFVEGTPDGEWGD